MRPSQRREQWARQDRYRRTQHRVVPDAGEEQDVAQDLAVERRAVEQRAPGRDAEAAVVEQANRERRVFEARKLQDDPITLEDLSKEFDVSRERIRQIEVRAFEKVQKAVKGAARTAETGTRE